MKCHDCKQQSSAADVHWQDGAQATVRSEESVPSDRPHFLGRSHFHRLALALAGSLAFYAMIPWFVFLPTFLAETLILGLWSVPALFFLAAFYPVPLFSRLEKRSHVLRVTILTVISFACSLASLFLVSGLMLLLSALAGVPLRAG